MQRIPNTDSIEELAKLWDTRDLTDFEDQLEEVSESVFLRGRPATVAVTQSPLDARPLKWIAKSEGANEGRLVRQWVHERLRKSV